ncbi:MAG: DUF3817 domain-containing protein [Lutibacter sp.]|nr:DUF3817 domain-containing protein [Lutibacter sp.]
MFSFFTIFRSIAFLEGVSYLLLLFIAVPIKYIAGDETYVKLLGMPHGFLFIGYIIAAFLFRADFKWNTKTFIIVLVASILPFGTFYVDRNYLK